MMIDLWEMRNKEVHGKEEVEKQQKRKDKTAISGRTLYEQKDQSRPRDPYIFYHNVEKEIKKATAAQLE